MSLLLALAAPAAAQSDPFSELGIPVAAPYSDPGAKAAKEKAAAKPPHPLEAALETRLAADLVQIQAARDGLLEVLAYAKGRPQAFPPAPVERAELFDEWRDEAGRAWARAADLLLALDAQASRYAAAPLLSTPRARAAAFSALALAYTARARFVRAFAPYADNDPLVKALFDAADPALGLPEGALSALTARLGGADGAAAAGLARAARQALKGVPRPQAPVFQRAERALDEDLRALPARGPRRFTLAEAAAALGPVLAGPVPAEPPPAAAPERPVPSFLPPPPPADAVTVSSQVAYARDVARRWFRLDASSQAVSLSRADARALAAALEPGDVLLARRWSQGSLGQGGWWGAAGLYVGGDDGRRAAFGDDSLSAELRALSPALLQTSTTTAPEDLPSVLAAGPGGVVVMTLAEFGAAEALAALRPRLPPSDKAEGLRRGAGALGRPYDPSQRPGGDALAEGEFLAHAYLDVLPFPEEPAAGPRAASPGGLAVAFDATFGTPRQAFDFVGGVRPGAEAEDRRMTLELFRALSRAPKWIFRDPKENAP